MDLFDAHSGNTHQPLAFRMRPRTLEEYIGQEHIIGKGRLLRRAIQMDQLSSIILYGPPGTGKTTLARVIANSTKSHFSTLNAVLSGVKELRYEIEMAVDRLKHYGTRTILFIDEVHRWNKSQQDALLPHVENGTCVLIGATTENPYFEVNPALVSRSRIFQLLQLSDKEMEKIAWQALRDTERGYGSLDVSFEKGALEHLIQVSNGDARSLLNALELAIETEDNTGLEGVGKRFISKSAAEESIQRKAVLYDKEGDYHFDTISAFIKSIRGSDADAALYWLAKMVHAGEHPSYIFRRLLISAAEDIGLADPKVIEVILSDAQAFDRIGLPEGRFHLAHATLYAATAPKSNSTLGFFDALKSVQQEKEGLVPNHLKDSSRDGKGFGHGEGYLYPHAYNDHWVAQQYLPSSLQGQIFYHPSDTGYEGQLKPLILSRREVQNEVPISPVDSENLTYSPVDKGEQRWLKRTLENQSDTFALLRDALFARTPVKRNHTVLITNPGRGFLVWEAVRQTPEGSVTVCCNTAEEKEYIDHYSDHLDLLKRPVTIVGSPTEVKTKAGIEHFDHIVSFNPFSQGSPFDIEEMAASLMPSGNLSFLQLIPSRTTRFSTFLSSSPEKAALEEAEGIYFERYYPGIDGESITDSLAAAGLRASAESNIVSSEKVFAMHEINSILTERYTLGERIREKVQTELVELIGKKKIIIEREFLIFSAQKS